jgi:nucleoside triphosphate pyrophosphatase
VIDCSIEITKSSNRRIMRLVLASASPRRADLLRAAGYLFETLAVDLDEGLKAGETPAAYVARLAHEKSAAAMQRILARAQTCSGPERSDPHDVVILGADTTVVVDGEILGKPRDDRDVAGMLRKLSGRAHEVLTGISLRTSAGEWGRVETTRVYMTELTSNDIAWYVASAEGRDKAGGYAVQGLASRFISRIDGSYANVVGLPVEAVSAVLRDIMGKSL